MKTIAAILIAVSFSILIIALLQKNSNYMNVSEVITKHFSTFTDAPIQFCAVFLVPAFLSIASVLADAVNDNLMENLLVAVSIFFSVFFAVMSILCSMTTDEPSTRPEARNTLINETFICAMFESIISVIVLVLLIGYQLLSLPDSWGKSLLQGVILYFVFLVITNMFVIIKRLQKLFYGIQETDSEKTIPDRKNR